MEDMVTVKQVLGYMIGIIVTGLSYWVKMMSAAIKRLEDRLNELPKEFVQRHEMEDVKTTMNRMDDKLDRVLTVVMNWKK